MRRSPECQGVTSPHSTRHTEKTQEHSAHVCTDQDYHHCDCRLENMAETCAKCDLTLSDEKFCGQFSEINGVKIHAECRASWIEGACASRETVFV
jgi:hypothetical protein